MNTMHKIAESLDDNYKNLVTHSKASDIYNGILDIIKAHRISDKCPTSCECSCCIFHAEVVQKKSNIDHLRFLISDTIIIYRRRCNV